MCNDLNIMEVSGMIEDADW